MGVRGASGAADSLRASALLLLRRRAIEAEQFAGKIAGVFVLPARAAKPARPEHDDYVAAGQRVKRDTTQALKEALAQWRTKR